MTKRQGPVVVDLDDDTPSPSDAPPIPEQSAPQTTVQVAAAVAARKPSILARWFWRLLLALIGFGISVAAYNFITGLIAQNPILGLVAMGLLGLFLFVCLLIIIKELRALMRLSRVDRLQKRAVVAHADGDLKLARTVVADVVNIYKRRPDAEWGLTRFNEQKADVFDADGLLGLAETTILTPLDAAAVKQVEAASRQVATVTALVPLALADVFAALTSNLRMIRQVAEIYEGRSGTLGNLRLTRSVLAHLVATGAVAVGDDIISHAAGGGIMSKFSRKFGEWVINGALTARVGVAAIEVCRPLPFQAVKPPKVTSVTARAMAGLFMSDKA
ncbi:MAG: YcjF family protein [Planktomarina sp.]